MTAGWCARTVRAAVFAAVCVLLAALGHVLMSGSTVPWWTLAAGLVGTCAVGWCLAGRERGVPLVVSVVVLAQGALHSAFSLVQSAGSADSMPSMGSVSTDAMDMGPMGAMGTGHSADAGHLGHVAHDMGGGSSSFGMLAAHALAALLTGLWLGHGERAAFRVLRAVAGWLAAPLRLPLALNTPPPHWPRPRPMSERAERVPRLTLAHTIISRGPPAGTAVV
ncbi:hypothetical protein [Streptomyces sp. NBC_00076]|uniref:hypothetical protein n=1 Tax=Streptomyces sp. NBC_00076 TaxID=2975642 RepID=UPI0032459D4C